ncbi:MAG: hypothetical protein WB535_07610 [Paenarthrobacter sp.]
MKIFPEGKTLIILWVVLALVVISQLAGTLEGRVLPAVAFYGATALAVFLLAGIVFRARRRKNRLGGKAANH